MIDLLLMLIRIFVRPADGSPANQASPDPGLRRR